MARTPGSLGTAVHLQPSEATAIRRVAGYFPPGTVTFNRIARRCIQAGVPIIEAEMQEAARKYNEAGQLVPVAATDEEPIP